jgi:hypothetical protein
MCGIARTAFLAPLKMGAKHGFSILGKTPGIGQYNDQVSKVLDPSRARDNASPEQQRDMDRRKNNLMIQSMLASRVHGNR